MLGVIVESLNYASVTNKYIRAVTEQTYHSQCCLWSIAVLSAFFYILDDICIAKIRMRKLYLTISYPFPALFYGQVRNVSCLVKLNSCEMAGYVTVSNYL